MKYFHLLGKFILPKDLGQISQYIVGKFTDIFYSVLTKNRTKQLHVADREAF